MDLISDALRQAFMPKHEYQNLRDEDKAWLKLQRPICVSIVCIISLAIVVSTAISLKIVFPGDSGNRPFCFDLRLQPLPINATTSGDSDPLPGAFYLTDQETVDYYYMVLFLPSSILFLASVVYLVAGFMVAYAAPQRHWCLKVVENNYCASRRATAIFLRRKAATILDEGNFSGRNLGLEMLEANPWEVTPDIERRVNEGFKTWMGSSLLSSDEEEESEEHEGMPRTSISQSSRQRLLT
uniref:Uncharacterized protein n=1 Tax=Chenopodium quinoa TaxID=63459 RepID=A0A803NC08_CHEQI